MGITDKLGHAAEELKNKGQDAVSRVTGKDDDDASGAVHEISPAENDTDAIGGNQIAGSVGGSTRITGGRTGADDI